MCIRDRVIIDQPSLRTLTFFLPKLIIGSIAITIPSANNGPCLLYTSDAADERSSVDLGGRRIIKKKTSSSFPVAVG